MSSLPRYEGAVSEVGAQAEGEAEAGVYKIEHRQVARQGIERRSAKRHAISGRATGVVSDPHDPTRPKRICAWR